MGFARKIEREVKRVGRQAEDVTRGALKSVETVAKKATTLTADVAKQLIKAPKALIEAGDQFVQKLGNVLEKAGKTFEKTVKAVIKDPLPMIETIALSMFVPYPIAAAAVQALNGGNIKQIAIATAATYLGNYGGAQVASLSAVQSEQIKAIIASSSGTAITSAVMKQPIDQVLNSALTGGVNAYIATELKAQGIDPTKVSSKILANSTSSAVNAILNGKSISDAIITSAAATAAASGVASAFEKYSKNNEQVAKLKSEIAANEATVDPKSLSAAQKLADAQRTNSQTYKELQNQLSMRDTYEQSFDKNMEIYNTVLERINQNGDPYGTQLATLEQAVDYANIAAQQIGFIDADLLRIDQRLGLNLGTSESLKEGLLAANEINKKNTPLMNELNALSEENLGLLKSIGQGVSKYDQEMLASAGDLHKEIAGESIDLIKQELALEKALAEAKSVEEKAALQAQADSKAAMEKEIAAAAEEEKAALRAKADAQAKLDAEAVAQARAQAEAKAQAEAQAAAEAKAAADAKAAQEAKLAAEQKAAREAQLIADAKAAEEAKALAEVQAARDKQVKAIAPGAVAADNGMFKVQNPDGSITTLDKDNNFISRTEPTFVPSQLPSNLSPSQLPSNALPSNLPSNAVASTNGLFTVKNPDGSTSVLDRNNNVVSYTPAPSTPSKPSGLQQALQNQATAIAVKTAVGAVKPTPTPTPKPVFKKPVAPVPTKPTSPLASATKPVTPVGTLKPVTAPVGNLTPIAPPVTTPTAPTGGLTQVSPPALAKPPAASGTPATDPAQDVTNPTTTPTIAPTTPTAPVGTLKPVAKPVGTLKPVAKPVGGLNAATTP